MKYSDNYTKESSKKHKPSRNNSSIIPGRFVKYYLRHIKKINRSI